MSIFRDQRCLGGRLQSRNASGLWVNCDRKRSFFFCRPASVCLSVRHDSVLNPDGRRHREISFSVRSPFSRERSSSVPQFGGFSFRLYLCLHSLAQNDQIRHGEGLFLGGQSGPPSQGGVCEPQFCGFAATCVNTVRPRTTTFGVVTHYGEGRASY